MRNQWFRFWRAIILAVLLLGMGLAPASAQEGGWQKAILAADDPNTLHAARQAGGELLADYGAFSLWRVPAAQTARLSALAGLDFLPELERIELRGGLSIDTRPGAAKPAVPARLAQTRGAQEQFWMVQFVGPLKDEWLAALDETGLRRVIYMPSAAYVVWGDGEALARLDKLARQVEFIQWSGPYHPAYRLEPGLQNSAAQPNAQAALDVTVQLFPSPALKDTLARLSALGRVIVPPWQAAGFTNLSLALPAEQLTALAAWDDVFNIEPYYAPRKLDEAQGQILAGNLAAAAGKVVPAAPAYLAWLAAKGFPTTPASYPLVAVVDDGIDNGSAIPLHADFYEFGSTSNPSRLAFNANCTADPSANGRDGHGNINAGIVAGYNNISGAPYEDANGYQRGLGVSPFGRVGGVKIFNNDGYYDVSRCGNSDSGIVQLAYQNGANFTSNSWGSSNYGSYNSDSQAYDALTRDAASQVGGSQQMLHIFAAGNDGRGGATTVGSPGTAKNVLTVGATENVRAEGYMDGCGASAGDNADDIADFSSRGPTVDGRVKPDVMAPGTHVQGPASQDPGYTGSSVCDKYYPAGQTLYAMSSGTSHSTPGVAGAVSLVWEYYRRALNPGQTPSPAMLKALTLNTPRYLNGYGTGGALPSNNQGWGDVDLGGLTDGSPRVLVDQTQTLGASGQVFQLTPTIADANRPLRVTLVWTDAPGSTTGAAYVNNLNLEVTAGGVTYRGNVFSGAFSVAGGAADARNNVENVFLPPGLSGPITVKVIAANIAGDGVPGNGDSTDQDFALLISNAAESPNYTLAVTPALAAVCAPDSAAFDVQIGALLGYSSPVTLSLAGQPAGTTPVFNPNPLTPPGASQLTIANTAAAAAGSYTLQIQAVSAAGNQAVERALVISTAPPGTPALTAPPNNAADLPAAPTFQWTPASQAASYTLEIASDAAFSSVVHAASGLTAASYTAPALAAGARYYWRVRALNGCGAGSASAVFTFVTQPALGMCPVDAAPRILYSAGFESGAGWMQSTSNSQYAWGLSSSAPHSGQYSAFAPGPPEIVTQSLFSPPLALPAGQNPLTLRFWHRPQLESYLGGDTCYDGGILEISANGGSAWTQVPEADLLAGKYQGTISPYFGSPFGGRRAWCGVSEYQQALVDLSDYAGQTIQLAFRLGSDSDVDDWGWAIDTLALQSCGAPLDPAMYLPVIER